MARNSGLIWSPANRSSGFRFKSRPRWAAVSWAARAGGGAVVHRVEVHGGALKSVQPGAVETTGKNQRTRHAATHSVVSTATG